MKLLILLVTVPLLWQGSYAQQDKKFFKKDYTYLEAPKSFYKIHTLPKTWVEAKKQCAYEGASLFFPENRNETETVLAYWNETQPFSWVYIGISSLLENGVFETLDGRQVEEVLNWSPGEPNNPNNQENCVILTRDGYPDVARCDRQYPFICKKTLDSLQWNTACNSPHLDYTYNATLGSCYKFHLRPLNWTDAYRVCSAEQSYLAVIDNKQEDDYFVKIIAEADKDNIQGNYVRGAVHLGFHNLLGDGWRIIKGDIPLEQSGFGTWVGGQPDGGDREHCGSMFYTGELNDMACSTRCFFICEHDVAA